MAKYEVRVSAEKGQDVYTTVVVDATSAEEAEKKALEEALMRHPDEWEDVEDAEPYVHELTADFVMVFDDEGGDDDLVG